MDRDTFLCEQFRTLREEIRETKARIFKTLAFGVAVVPAAQFLAQSYDLEIVLYSTPLLVIVIALLFLSENHALMRCGRYILYEIEPFVPDAVGWETWLERKGPYDPRTVDKFLAICFYLLFFVYFTGSVFIATRTAYATLGQVVGTVLLGIYIVIGGWFLIFLFKSSKTSTHTVFDDHTPQAPRGRAITEPP